MLKQTARRILEAEAKRFGVSLDTGDVLRRRTGRQPRSRTSWRRLLSW